MCITASATRDGLNLIAVVLGAPSSKERFEAATTLLDYGFAAYRAAPVPLPQERPLQLKVKGSTEETVPLDYAALPATALLPAESAGQLTVQLELPDTLEAPVTRGQTVGKAQLLCGEAVQGSTRCALPPMRPAWILTPPCSCCGTACGGQQPDPVPKKALQRIKARWTPGGAVGYLNKSG